MIYSSTCKIAFLASLFHCGLTFVLYFSFKLLVLRPQSYLELFRELNLQHFNFCRDSLQQFLNEIIRKKLC